MRLILIGFMGVGKTTLGRACAAELDLPWFDTDAFLSEKLGVSPSQFIREHGIASWREQERGLAKTVRSLSSAIISTGGGYVVQPICRQSLKTKDSFIIHLHSELRELLPRIDDRPLVADAPRLYDERIVSYRALAHREISCTGRSVGEILSDVCTEFSHWQSMQALEPTSFGV